jgi:hypothetical protein
LTKPVDPLSSGQATKAMRTLTFSSHSERKNGPSFVFLHLYLQKNIFTSSRYMMNICIMTQRCCIEINRKGKECL